MQIQKKNKRDSNQLFLTSQISSYVRVKNEILVMSKTDCNLPTHLEISGLSIKNLTIHNKNHKKRAMQ